jgi:hypothetical protein
MTIGVRALLDDDHGDPRIAILRQAQLQAAIRNYGFKLPRDNQDESGATIKVRIDVC